MKKISNFEEKKWILAYFMKRRKGVGKESALRAWTGWWKEDFIPDPGYKTLRVYNQEVHNWNCKKDHHINTEYTDILNDIVKFVQEVINQNNIDTIRKHLYKVKAKSGRSIPEGVKYKAKRLGYRVSRTIPGKNHPLRVCGYYIYKDDKIIYGKSHDLDLDDVKEFLHKEAEKVKLQKHNSKENNKHEDQK